MLFQTFPVVKLQQLECSMNKEADKTSEFTYPLENCLFPCV